MANIFDKISAVGTRYNLFELGLGRKYGTNPYVQNQSMRPPSNIQSQYDIGGNPVRSYSNSSQYSNPIGPVQPQQQRISTPTRNPQPVFNPLNYNTQPKGPQGSQPNINTFAPKAVDPGLNDADRQRQELLSELDAANRGNQDFLGGLKNSYESDFGNIKSAISGSFNALRPAVGQVRDEGLRAVGLQKNAEQERGRNALNEGLSLFNELSRRNQQQFGGGNSVGRFASELQGRELQQGQGQQRQATDQNMMALDNKALDIQQRADVEMQRLAETEQSELRNAQSELNQQLRQIDAQRQQSEQWKSGERLNALRDFHDRRNNLQDQARGFAQQIQSQVLAAQQNVHSALQQFQINAGKMPDMQSMPGADFSLPGGEREQSFAGGPQRAFLGPEEEQQAFRPLFAEEEPSIFQR